MRRHFQHEQASVHQQINARLWMCREQHLLPTKIMLGKHHTRLFLQERGWTHVPRETFYYAPRLPVEFNVPSIYGIAIETVPYRPEETSST